MRFFEFKNDLIKIAKAYKKLNEDASGLDYEVPKAEMDDNGSETLNNVEAQIRRLYDFYFLTAHMDSKDKLEQYEVNFARSKNYPAVKSDTLANTRWCVFSEIFHAFKLSAFEMMMNTVARETAVMKNHQNEYDIVLKAVEKSIELKQKHKEVYDIIDLIVVRTPNIRVLTSEYKEILLKNKDLYNQIRRIRMIMDKYEQLFRMVEKIETYKLDKMDLYSCITYFGNFNFIKDLRNVFADMSTGDGWEKYSKRNIAVNQVIAEHGLSEFGVMRFIEFCKDLFHVKNLWQNSMASFGGGKWAAVCEGYLALVPVGFDFKDDGKAMSLAIDHMFDLQHNSGPLMNKLPYWQKLYDALNVKRDIRDVSKYFSRISPSLVGYFKKMHYMDSKKYEAPSEMPDFTGIGKGDDHGVDLPHDVKPLNEFIGIGGGRLVALKDLHINANGTDVAIPKGTKGGRIDECSIVGEVWAMGNCFFKNSSINCGGGQAFFDNAYVEDSNIRMSSAMINDSKIIGSALIAKHINMQKGSIAYKTEIKGWDDPSTIDISHSKLDNVKILKNGKCVIYASDLRACDINAHDCSFNNAHMLKVHVEESSKLHKFVISISDITNVTYENGIGGGSLYILSTSVTDVKIMVNDRRFKSLVLNDGKGISGQDQYERFIKSHKK
jgi:hypothetical protein